MVSHNSSFLHLNKYTFKAETKFKNDFIILFPGLLSPEFQLFNNNKFNHNKFYAEILPLMD